MVKDLLLPVERRGFAQHDYDDLNKKRQPPRQISAALELCPVVLLVVALLPSNNIENAPTHYTPLFFPHLKDAAAQPRGVFETRRFQSHRKGHSFSVS